MVTRNRHRGADVSSTTSASDKCLLGSNWMPSGTRNSPARRNPKKPTEHAAQMSTLRREVEGRESWVFIRRIKEAVIGSRTRADVGWA